MEYPLPFDFDAADLIADRGGPCRCGICAIDRGEAIGPPATTIDENALAAIARRMGVRRPVRVALHRYPDDKRTCGDQRLADDRESHEIRINARLTPKYANETLAHELRHAAQADHFGPDVLVAAYNLCRALYGYRDNPFEVDARRVEHVLGPSLKVIS